MSKLYAESEAPSETFKKKCYQCLKGPNLIRTLVVLLCSCVVVQQITACVRKLINIPITTHTHFDFNETIMYPSLTFCREPPYKYDKMEEYGLYSHPRFTSVWRDFNFTHVTLDYLWEEITYSSDEFFVQYGFDGLVENVEVDSSLGFVMGRCYTLTPRVLSYKASQSAGYSLTLRHNALDIANSITTTPPGYHVYVHYSKEPFTEVEVYNGGLVDYLYVNTGETIDVKLSVDQYQKISRDHDPCVNWENYSTNECTTKHVSYLVGEAVGCSGPWMLSDLPRCDNYNDMRSLITEYINMYEDHNYTSCPRICRSYLYNAFVTFRRSDYTWDSMKKVWALNSGVATLETHLYIHFNTMMVSVYEERYNYDWNLFLSDLGGSIGFLLGLSVVGLMSMFGKLWGITVQPFIKPKDAPSSPGSAATADVKTVSKDLAMDLDYLKKCQEWHIKNDCNKK
ncbi:degenerin-like protein asic-1 [Cydia splendana]|uniref:degenerin-like protein asic-1 n=1 Tax=Cydia splendana TaxID=1100963 RepID=UPI00300D450A